jgi:hypothetical protein
MPAYKTSRHKVANKRVEYTLNDEKLTSISSKSFFSFTEKPSVAFLVDDI